MTARLRILFVDDETAILDGLRRLLRPLRDEWEIFTANGGLEALALLEREAMDVIVSDMRMPEIDGAQLLEAVRHRHPHMARIVLSGQSDQEALLRAVGPVHQYLNKPCDLALLKATVGRSRALRAAINDPAIAELAAGMTSLPSLSGLYLKILECLRSSDQSMARLGGIIAQDIGMSARVLQLVNSALFGLTRTVTSPVEAVALLGVNVVRSMTLAIEALNHGAKAHAGGIDPELLWQHSLVVAHLAKAIAQAERQPPDLCDTAFTAGLLHECGLLVLANHLPEQYRAPAGVDHHSAAYEIPGSVHTHARVSHADVGGYLLSLWGLPDALIEAVVFHHRPGDCPATGFTALTAVHVAEAFERCGATIDAGRIGGQLDLPYLARLGLTPRIPAWVDVANDLRSKAGVR
jgi:HD-like signal output (HDOD) protein